MDTDHLATALRASAAGFYPLEAGTELLIGNGMFLHRDDFTTRYVHHGTSEATPMAAIDWDAVITALASGNLPCSGGKRRILLLSASLAGGILVDLRDTVTDSTTATPPSWSPQSGTQPANNPRTEDIETHTDSSQISIFHRAPARI